MWTTISVLISWILLTCFLQRLKSMADKSPCSEIFPFTIWHSTLVFYITYLCHVLFCCCSWVTGACAHKDQCNLSRKCISGKYFVGAKIKVHLLMNVTCVIGNSSYHGKLCLMSSQELLIRLRISSEKECFTWTKTCMALHWSRTVFSFTAL